MNAYKTILVVNVFVILLTGFAIYYTHSLWSVLILFFMMKSEDKEDDDNR